MKQQPDEDPTTYDKPSGMGGRVFMGCGVLCMIGLVIYVNKKVNNR